MVAHAARRRDGSIVCVWIVWTRNRNPERPVRRKARHAQVVAGQVEAQRLEAEAGQDEETPLDRRNDLRNLLTELAERTTAVAASL